MVCDVRSELVAERWGFRLVQLMLRVRMGLQKQLEGKVMGRQKDWDAAAVQPYAGLVAMLLECVEGLESCQPR